MKIENSKICFFALSAHGQGISGGDRIFIEFARRWSLKNKIEIFLWKEGRLMCERNNLIESENLKFHIVSVPEFITKSFLICYLYRIILGIFLGLTVKKEQWKFLYSASEFWMDIFPAVVLKLRDRKLVWVSTWYQTAPSLFKGFSLGDRDKRYFKSAVLYNLSQLIVKPLIKLLGDIVLVNNYDELKEFPKLSDENKVFVVLGAVDLDKITRYKRLNKVSKKRYEAVFQGRFHPQKGVVELIEIWKLVVRKLPKAKLIMIGDGPLKQDVIKKIKDLKLSENIILKGYLFDGEEKYRIFSSSKIVLHPAFYDSGGMASAEAMAFGLPCIAFDLPAYRTYYPKGLVKVKIGDKKAFSEGVVELLRSKKLYIKISKEALDLVYKNLSWKDRARQVLKSIQHQI